jgi:hypothetical protein
MEMSGHTHGPLLYCQSKSNSADWTACSQYMHVTLMNKTYDSGRKQSQNANHATNHFTGQDNILRKGHSQSHNLHMLLL